MKNPIKSGSFRVPENEFDGEPENDKSFHVEKCGVGCFLEFFNCRKNAQHQTGKNHHETGNKKKIDTQILFPLRHLLLFFVYREQLVRGKHQ